MINILVIGQNPPPYNGQAIMIEKMMRISDPRFRFHLVRMNFSDTIAEHGKMKVKKIFHLLFLIPRIAYGRIATGSTVLYYPPAGPNKLPMYRDLIILLSVRWMFSKTVFHFHAGGVTGLYPGLSKFMRFCFRKAYFNPTAGILISDLNPQDTKFMRSGKEFVIPNGVQDVARNWNRSRRLPSPITRILFVGAIREGKGLLVLLEAARILRARKHSFVVELMGSYESAAFEAEAREKIRRDGTSDVVRFLGVLSGDPKFEEYSQSHIFCFPSHYEAETFGIVILEAMSFGLPVVATRWRGIPSIVEEGRTGYLVPIKDAPALADRLEKLILDPALRESLGKEGRSLFERKFTLEKFHANIISMLESI